MQRKNVGKILLLGLGLALTKDMPVHAATAGVSAEARAAVDHVLTTTRSVRKRLDLTRPVEPKVIEEALDIAVQAPTGSNVQGWHFLVVTDPQAKKAIADLYRKAADGYRSRRPQFPEGDPRRGQQDRMVASGLHLYQHMHEVPAIVFFGIDGRVEKEPPATQAATYGSILPSAWSFMLALRARGVGATWTTLALNHERELAKLLRIPDTVTLAVMMPVAYYTGSGFKPAERLPVRERTYWDAWGKKRP